MVLMLSMASPPRRFVLLWPRNFIRAIKVEAAKRGQSASRMISEKLLKDGEIGPKLPKVAPLKTGLPLTRKRIVLNKRKR